MTTKSKKVKAFITFNGRVYELRKSKFATNASPVIVSDYMSGKMTEIPSISTSVLLNTICQERRKIKGSVCEHCFAAATAEFRKELRQNLETNYHLLTEQVLPMEALPVFKDTVKIARIESFGDIQNENQVLNYINIIRKNPNVTFGWWSKNIKIIENVMTITGKPKNMVLIQSSMFVNKEEKRKSKFVDKIFTVYNDPYIREVKTIRECLKAMGKLKKKEEKEEVTKIFEKHFINCGARSCMRCGKCYNTHDTTFLVKERLK